MIPQNTELGTCQGQYSVVRVRVPGQDVQTVGVLLVDAADRLHYRLTDLILSNDDLVLAVWEETAQMMGAMADTLGGRGLLQHLESLGSNFLEISSPISINLGDPKAELLRLYDQHVLPMQLQSRFGGLQKIGRSAIEASCSTLPNISTGVIDVLRRYRDGRLELDHLERLLDRDPIVSGQIVRLANVAGYSRGLEVRSIRQALTRVGTEAAFGFIVALSFKPVFSSPNLRAVWNLAVRCREAAVTLAKELKLQHVEEVGLLALVADVGKIVLLNIPGFEQNYENLRTAGYGALACEVMLTGTTHAEISASILDNWSFPRDMTEAVRFHHMPDANSSTISAVLYLSGCSVESAEVECNLDQYRAAFERLQSSCQTKLSEQLAPGITARREETSTLLVF